MVLNNYALQGNYNQALSELKQYSEALNYYEQTGLPQAEEIARTAKEGYRLGIIGYYNYIINLQQVIKIRLGYLEALKNYNQAIFTIQFLKGE
jgi:cobalt-zinc-cadmium resistance protein CzcA